MRLFIVLVAGLIGAIVGYFIGVYAGCDWLYTGSNLCGIYGLMLTGPIGLMIGLVLGWRLSRPPSAE